MKVVDSQVHFWRDDTADHPWSEESRRFVAAAAASSARRPGYGPDELRAEMARAGVDRCVIVPPVFAGDDNSYAVHAAAADPDHFTVMGRLTLDEPMDDESFAAWWAKEGLAGIRLTFFYERHRKWLDDGTGDWLWPLLERHAIPFALYAPGCASKIADIAQRHPGLRIAVDHCAIPLETKDEDTFAYFDALVELARFSNVSVKVSALPSYTSEPYPFSVLHDQIHKVYDAFGPRRMFWGSEMTRLDVPYGECVRLFTEALPFLSEQDKEWIMGRAICEWLPWP